MHILIDTHIFLWLLYDTKKINSGHIKILQDSNNHLYLSSVSIAEIMIKKSIGKLDVTFDIDLVKDKLQLEFLDFDVRSAMILGSLPLHHRDPFDRMIIAQSLASKYTIMSVDTKFEMYDCELLS